MADMYRLAVLNADGEEVMGTVTLTVNPNDILVVMPPSVDMHIMQAQSDLIIKALAHHGIKGIVFPFPVVFARLERIEP